MRERLGQRSICQANTGDMSSEVTGKAAHITTIPALGMTGMGTGMFQVQ